MKQTARGILILSASAAAACAVCYWAVTMLAPQAEPLPNPNGYIDFLAAANLFNTASQSVDLTHATTEQLRAFVLTNRAALDRLRLGLGRRCGVPVEYSTAYMQKHLTELAEIKQDARALQAQGRLAELENRPADAADSYLAEMQLGVNASHGGVLIDLMVSTACEDMAAQALANAIHILDAEQSRQMARQLEELDRRREPADRFVQRERSWARNSQPLVYLIYSLKNMMTHGSSDPLAAARNSAIAKHQAQRRRTLQLEVGLAARAYELAHGRPPAGWNDLVPIYLQRVPADPDTKSNLYRKFGLSHSP